MTEKTALEKFLEHWQNLAQTRGWRIVQIGSWIRARRPNRDVRPMHPIGAVALHLYGRRKVANPNLVFDPRLRGLLGLSEDDVSELYRATDFLDPRGSAADLRGRLLASVQDLA